MQLVVIVTAAILSIGRTTVSSQEPKRSSDGAGLSKTHYFRVLIQPAKRNLGIATTSKISLVGAIVRYVTVSTRKQDTTEFYKENIIELFLRPPGSHDEPILLDGDEATFRLLRQRCTLPTE